jgi:hypothetical protein
MQPRSRHYSPHAFVAFLDNVFRETKKFLIILGYLWILFSLFALHKWILSDDESFIYNQGMAIIHALVLAKVLFLAESMNLEEQFRDRPLIYPVLFKAALFGIVLTCFQVIEGVVTGTLRGKTAAESIAHIGGGGIEGIAAVGTIIFVVLIPFFAFREMVRLIGNREMHDLFFVRQKNLDRFLGTDREAGSESNTV